MFEKSNIVILIFKLSIHLLFRYQFCNILLNSDLVQLLCTHLLNVRSYVATIYLQSLALITNNIIHFFYIKCIENISKSGCPVCLEVTFF